MHGRLVLHSILKRRETGVSTHHRTVVHNAFRGVDRIDWDTFVISTCFEDRNSIIGSSCWIHQVNGKRSRSRLVAQLFIFDTTGSFLIQFIDLQSKPSDGTTFACNRRRVAFFFSSFRFHPLISSFSPIPSPETQNPYGEPVTTERAPHFPSRYSHSCSSQRSRFHSTR